MQDRPTKGDLAAMMSPHVGHQCVDATARSGHPDDAPGVRARRGSGIRALNGGTEAAYHGSFSRVAHPKQPVARGVGMRSFACPRRTVEAQL